MVDIDTSTLAHPNWIVDAGNSKQANYVIVVGESMRRDYMSLFGYPTQITPFLDQVKGIFYSDYISTAPNTFESLPRTLALSDGKKIILQIILSPWQKPQDCILTGFPTKG
ncbi:sulfatase-like hydrolase/transferase [Serratia proteamaculans]|uniref:sulfatase-like hydrolase/transferase n=1 Tax=Serratia proteamaculans TaxID=28151 RepID=UPI002980C3CE|nr:sulfatase-like hydrolase/transferase [Serratia proteamaculans]MDW5502177.1 sulfatase-like hydrolase/transferase [Serratia proteamaculans]